MKTCWAYRVAFAYMCPSLGLKRFERRPSQLRQTEGRCLGGHMHPLCKCSDPFFSSRMRLSLPEVIFIFASIVTLVLVMISNCKHRCGEKIIFFCISFHRKLLNNLRVLNRSFEFIYKFCTSAIIGTCPWPH